ncbi:carbon monoxide dehydrogenase subunit G [Mumia flava]|uniref:Carbon monoxide dehydrogenase subunit G n=1 Tax=Mumia flava TaxID=1348852 RepID=A0A0B2BET5_9ACTN|nr:SRPBCC family protein [Mumia flava]PJJ57191.1 carbon monoxide dehydrogenase subunit G [Mumia flava]
MELQHTFTVPINPGEAAAVLHDVRRLAPCVPGATLDDFDGHEFSGRMTVKVGAIVMAYQGAGRFLDGDDRTIPLRVEARETKGAGGAAADVVCRLDADGDGTRVVVDTRLDISGRPAQFGRGVISEVGDRVIAAFADNLRAELLRGANAGAGAAEADRSAAPAAAPLDLGSVAGPVIARRLAPAGVVLAIAAAFLLGRRSAH